MVEELTFFQVQSPSEQEDEKYGNEAGFASTERDSGPAAGLRELASRGGPNGIFPLHSRGNLRKTSKESPNWPLSGFSQNNPNTTIMNKNDLMKTFLAASVAGGFALSASAQVLVDEDFESGIGNWTLGTGGSLDTEFGNPGQSGAHDGSASIHSWAGSSLSVMPTDENPVVLSADIYDSGAASQRNTLGFRTGADPLFEMGQYLTSGYAVRVLNFAGNENWVSVASDLTAGWNRWEATFTADTLVVTLDLGIDGTIDHTLTSTGSGFNNAFTDLRFGGPSGTSSSGGGFNIDNINLEVIPEPSTYAAIFGGLALVGAFVYRRRLNAKK